MAHKEVLEWSDCVGRWAVKACTLSRTIETIVINDSRRKRDRSIISTSVFRTLVEKGRFLFDAEDDNRDFFSAKIFRQEAMVVT